MTAVALTAQEAAAHELAAGFTDRNVELGIYAMLYTHGVREPRVSISARQLAPAALSARKKIAEAPDVEVEVIGFRYCKQCDEDVNVILDDTLYDDTDAAVCIECGYEFWELNRDKE